MNIIELVIDDNEETHGISAISVVDRPAIERDAYYFKDGKPEKLSEAKQDERGLFTGPALIPNKLIYRETEKGEPYYVRFSKETVYKLSEKYMAEQRGKDWTEQHESDTNGLFTLESWIVEDPEMDKSNLFFEEKLPKGTWMITTKITDEAMKEKIKTGEINGYSIEAVLVEKYALEALERNLIKELETICYETDLGIINVLGNITS